jgi:hypothetical protein
MSDQSEKSVILLPLSRQAGPGASKNTILALIVLAVFVALCYRMSIGVDLSDESYYISFIDGWLKTGIKSSSVLVIHQTAELLVFPFARIFTLLNNGTEGLALFLRSVYLMASCFSAICFYFFCRTKHELGVSIFAGLLIASFIPFSLPSPSYNTLGMLGMISALSALGVYLHKHSTSWAIVSAVSWAICVIAYPTLAVVLAVTIVSLPAVGTLSPRRKLIAYVALCVALQTLGVLLLLSVYGWAKLNNMLAFTNASLQISSGSSGKFTRSVAMLTADIGFLPLCAVAMVVGALSARVSNSVRRGWFLSFATVFLLTISYAIGPIVFARSHDFVLIISVMGAAFFPAKIFSRSPNRDDAAAFLFAIGILAGIVTSMTATNGIVNFAVGGFFAAAVFLISALVPGRLTVAPQLTLIGVVVAFFLFSSFNFIYGERESLYTSSSSRIANGVFAGLLTTRPNKEAIEKTMDFLARLPGDSVTVLGRFPGIYLLTSMRPKALSTWDFGQQNGTLPKVDHINELFYAMQANRPEVLLSVIDPWTRNPSPYGQKLLSEYRQSSQLKLVPWTVDAFSR